MYICIYILNIHHVLHLSPAHLLLLHDHGNHAGVLITQPHRVGYQDQAVCGVRSHLFSAGLLRWRTLHLHLAAVLIDRFCARRKDRHAVGMVGHVSCQCVCACVFVRACLCFACVCLYVYMCIFVPCLSARTYTHTHNNDNCMRDSHACTHKNMHTCISLVRQSSWLYETYYLETHIHTRLHDTRTYTHT